jgi:hypothetical protein
MAATWTSSRRARKGEAMAGRHGVAVLRKVRNNRPASVFIMTR